jgi:hypothetical protein
MSGTATFRGLTVVDSVSAQSAAAHRDYTKTRYDGTNAIIYGDATLVAACLAADDAYTIVGPAETNVQGKDLDAANGYTTELGDF